jgi:nitroreductase
LAEFEQIILGRRSIRKYRKSPISDEIVRHILKMATYAPIASICFMDKWGEVTNEQGTK